MQYSVCGYIHIPIVREVESVSEDAAIQQCELALNHRNIETLNFVFPDDTYFNINECEVKWEVAYGEDDV